MNKPLLLPSSQQQNHHSKMNQAFLLLIILTVMGLPSCASQNPQHDCNIQPFSCGSLGILSYPFHPANLSSSCGYPDFGITCSGKDAPYINMSSISYRVLAIRNRTRTITVARNDLWSTPCSQLLTDTLLDPTLYSLNSSDQKIALLYGCNDHTLPSGLLPYQFDCNFDGIVSIGFFFRTSEVQNLLSAGVTCAGSGINVRINQTAAAALETNPSIALLQTSLQSGFSIGWMTDDQNCQNCVGSGGSCGYYPNSTSFACYCDDDISGSTCRSRSNPNGSGKGLSNAQKYAITGALLICVVIPVIVPIICYFAIPYISTYLENKSNPDVQQFLVNHGSLAQKRYSYFEIKKITKSFKDKLGQGGFGTVYKGNLPDGQPVAVKVLTQSRDDKDAEDFINEVASISRTSHVNIVNLLGFCYGRNKRALVYEFMPNKSLDSYINNAELSLEWNKLFEIAVGVARGLEYLHRGCNTRIVHFDIKPQNILLDEDFSPKISDFGLAKLCMKKGSIISMLGMRGTIGYIAPEVFSRNFGVVSHKSDVYSYGMMLLEMAEAQKVVETEATLSSESYFPDNIYEHVLIRKEIMDDVQVRDEKEESEIKMLMVGIWCIQTAPSDRPSMSKVLDMLEGSLQSIQIPPKPFFPLQSGAVEFSSSMNMDSENST